MTAKLRDFGFEVPEHLKRRQGKAPQNRPNPGHKKDVPGKQPHNAAAAAEDDVMTQQATETPNTNPQQEAPKAGGDVFENLAAQFAGEAVKGLADQVDRSTGKRVRWGRVKEVGMYVGAGTAAAVVVIVVKAAIEKKGVFAPTPAAPTTA